MMIGYSSKKENGIAPLLWKNENRQQENKNI